jgi:hypothetical protein
MPVDAVYRVGFERLFEIGARVGKLTPPRGDGMLQHLGDRDIDFHPLHGVQKTVGLHLFQDRENVPGADPGNREIGQGGKDKPGPAWSGHAPLSRGLSLLATCRTSLPPHGKVFSRCSLSATLAAFLASLGSTKWVSCLRASSRRSRALLKGNFRVLT